MLKLKVLFIDDEIDYCHIMESYFAKKNYDVTLAYTLEEGMEKLSSVKPDILFLDNNLPDGKGWEHVDNIVEKNPHMRLYLVSAYHMRNDFSFPYPQVVIWEKPLSMSVLNETF